MSTSKTKLFQVDAFTDKAFMGNPAAICLLEASVDKEWMQSVASEMNLSETAFVNRNADGFDLRWFTPTIEVDLCGHATLAAAHILWEQDWLPKGESALFRTASGVLTAQRNNNRIVLDFPATPVQPVAAPEKLFPALGIKTGNIFFNQVDYLVELENETEVNALQPEFSILAKIPARGFIVTAPSKQTEYDFISRFFGPACGINEDPVTGSAHCSLAPFWSNKSGKTEMLAYQASARGGELWVKLQDDRVLLAGNAITVFGGELYV